MLMKEHNYFSFFNNTATAQVINNDIEKNQIHHAYMIVATNNQTANMFARFFAFKILCKNKSACLTCENCLKALSGSNADFKTYPKAKSLVVEDIEDIVENSYKKPIEGTEKVFILHDFESSNQTAQNKLLKTLEEPTENTHLILSVSNPSLVLQTIKSRCKQVNVSDFSADEIRNFLVNNGYNSPNLNLVCAFSNSNIGSVIKNLQNSDFVNLINLVFDLFQNCNKSSQIINYVSKILSYKNNLATFFELVEIVINKALLAKNVDTKDIPEIMEISESFSTLSLNAINKQISIAKEKLKFNCNVVAVVDMFVLKFLEEKYKWK